MNHFLRSLTLVVCSLLASVAGAAPGGPKQVTHECTGPLPDAVSLDGVAVYFRLRELYQSEQFDKLDAALSCFVASEARLQSGHSGAGAAYAFYKHLMPAPGTRPDEQGRVERWRKAKPESPYGELAALRLRYALAWTARTGKFASEVSEEGWKQFREGISATEKDLRQASPWLKDTPLWQQLWLVTLQSKPDSDAEAAKAFAEGVRKWPTFYDFYEAALLKATPRWGGSWTQVEAFADKWSRATQKAEGDSLYARLYLHLAWNGMDPRQTKVEWPRLRASLIALVERYPTALHVNMAASMACLYSDGEAFRKVMKGIPGFIPNVWQFGTNYKTCIQQFP